MDTNQEANSAMKAEPTETQKELALAQQKEKKECWQALADVLEKYGYGYDVTLTINGSKGVGFIIDLQKKPKE